MKNKRIMAILLGSFLLAQASYADSARDRLLKEADRMVEVKAAEEKKVAEEAAAQEKVRREHMTESQKMDLEVQRIKGRMMEINKNIETYEKANETLNQLEEKVKGLQHKVQ